jgi:ABC-2 type transport system ATP-binding protein
MEYSIETFALSKVYSGRTVVQQLCLRVPKGSFYGFLGPNGAGKSTTIKMLTGITTPTSGEVRILGYDLQRNSLTVKRRIGVVPEEQCLFENLTASEYLVFMARMYGLPKHVALQRCEELLQLMKMDDTGDKLVLEFSTGMKKKLSLCAAMIHDPEVLFLDEPFEGIDAIASRSIRIVLEQSRRRGVTIFLTSHIMEVVERLCSHVSIIHEGNLLFQGTLDELSGGSRLDDAFLRIVGEQNTQETGLSWLGARK